VSTSNREKHLHARDNFQKDLDDNRQWHRPQEHTFEVDATGPQGGDAKSQIVGGTAAGFVFLDTHGEKRLDKDSVHTLIGELQAAFQAVS
jgi:hypothetical protein